MKNPLWNMTPAMQLFIRCIVCGDPPEHAVQIAYPGKKYQDVWAAKLLCNRRVVHAIDVLTKGKITPHARRIELLKIVEGKDTTATTKLAALKELGRIEESLAKSPEERKAAPQNDTLQEKLHILEKKAKAS